MDCVEYKMQALIVQKNWEALFKDKYREWTYDEFEEKVSVQSTLQIKNHMPCKLPAVITDIIASYAILAMSESLQKCPALFGYYMLFGADIPTRVRAMLTHTVEITNALFLIFLCRYFGAVGLRLISESIKSVPQFPTTGQTIPLRTTLLYCMYELNMISFEAGFSHEGFFQLDAAKNSFLLDDK
jgi:hypothetical protein